MPQRDQEIALLRREIELMMGERQALLRVAGSAAVLIASLDSKRLPVGAVEAADLVATHINHLILSHASELLGRTETQALLEHIAKESPKLVEDLVPKLLPLATVQRVLQNLLDEGVNIRDMRSIVEVLAEHAPRIQDALELTSRVRQALGRAGLDRIEPVALLNDTTATLLSSVYQHNPSRIGIVCGTGFNMCYYEPALQMIVNLEAAGFDGGPATVWDRLVDEASQLPGDHPFEKMIGGRYLSEVCRVVFGEYLKRDIPYFTTRDMNELISGQQTAEELLGFAVSEEEQEGLCALVRAVFARAAQLIGAASFGLLSHLAEDKGFTEQSIAIEGSLVEKIKGVPSLIEDAICVFCMAPTENTRIHVIPNSNGASVGAAIAAALCR